jgi:hypothetical protein
MSMKNSNDTIGNQSRDLPVCSTVPQSLCHRVHLSLKKYRTNFQNQILARKVVLFNYKINVVDAFKRGGLESTQFKVLPKKLKD